MKILIISGGLLPPEVHTAGTGAIYNLLRQLSKFEDLDVYVLTAKSRWSAKNVNSWVDLQKKKHNLTFHVVNANGLFWTRFLFFWKALKLCRQRRFNLIHDYSSLPVVSLLTGILGKLCRAKTIQTICTTEERFFANIVVPPNWGVVDKVIVTSKKMKKRIPNAEYIPLGVDAEKFSTTKMIAERPRDLSRQKTILFLGSLEERKGAFVLARAVGEVIKEHPAAKLVFATLGKEGRDPNYEDHKKRLIRTLKGLESHYKILEGKHDVPQLMADATIFVLPAISPHGTLAQPQTLLEAMSMGKTCVVSSIQKGDGLVNDGVNCLLFNSGDPNDLAEKINLLLSDIVLRQRLEQAAREKIVGEFEVKAIAEKLHRQYLALISPSADSSQPS